MQNSAKSQLSIDRYYLKQTRILAKKCPLRKGSFAVGAILITQSGNIYTGYSCEWGVFDHAEEVAFEKARNADDDTSGATLYSSLEPCSDRSSKPLSCSALTIQNKVARVCFGKREGTEFVADCTGAEDMQAAGIEVIEGIL